MEVCSLFISIALLIVTVYSESTKVLSTTFSEPMSNYNKTNVYLVKNTAKRKCFNNYSTRCLKIDLMKLMDYLYLKKNFEILPGLLIEKRSDANKFLYRIPPDVLHDISDDKNSSKSKLDHILFQKIIYFIKSHSIKFNYNYTLDNIKNTGSHLVNMLATVINNQTARSKKATLVWSAGVIAAVAFAMLAAIAGKAVMASMLALLISVFTLLRGSNGGGGDGNGGVPPGMNAHKGAHYEIITKPLIYSSPGFSGVSHYYDNENMFSGSYSPSYDYARTMNNNAQKKTTASTDNLLSNAI